MTHKYDENDSAATSRTVSDCGGNRAPAAAAGDDGRLREVGPDSPDAVAAAIAFMEEYAEVFEELAK